MTRAALAALLMMLATSANAQDLPEGPKPVEDFEADADGDGIPDGWYNLRDARVAEGGVGGPKSKCFRFENARAGRPARASRAFGVDGRQVEAVIIGLKIRQESIAGGERLGDEPGLVIDFLGDPVQLQLRAVRRGVMGPWKTVGRDWTKVSKRMPIPPDTRLAILSVGLLGATGVLEVDDLTIDLVPVGGKESNDLVLNGDFELGDPDPAGWLLDRGAKRSFPGNRSDSAVELKGAGARAYAGLALPVSRFRSLEVSAMARASGLRGASGAIGSIFFLDEDGRPLGAKADGTPALNFAGSFPWQSSRANVEVPPGASRAVVQFEKPSAYGTITLDDVKVVAENSTWTPGHVETVTTGWLPIKASPSIVAGSALDASTLLEAPAGKRGAVVVKDGRLAFADGTRARFFGVTILPPAGFPDASKADELADRLARSGINLVRLGDLDTPLGPARSLFDDARDDTKALDPEALGRLDHFIAALKKRGVYVALELQGARRFRDGDADAIPGARMLPPGGGPAAAFDPGVREAARKAAEGLLTRVNPETGLALRDDPALAWVTLAGELSLFDLVDAADKDARSETDALRELMRRDNVDKARRAWQAVESEQWKALAADLRKLGLKAPLAGGSHWRRDHDYVAAQLAPGLDLIDDRIFYAPPSWAGPERRSSLFSREGGMISGASKKRKADRPYVVGQWAIPTFGAWASPTEGADLMLAAQSAASEDWDGLVRRGVFLFPKVWGEAAAGTGGGEDIFAIGEVINGIPQTFALFPHAASVLRHASDLHTGPKGAATRAAKQQSRAIGVVGWDAREGRLAIDSPHTVALAGWVGESAAKSDAVTIDISAPFGVVAVSSLGREPIASGRRLLVTAVARVEPTGFRWLDEWRREPAEPGRPPLLHETVRAKVSWRHRGEVKAYALDNTGARIAPAPLEKTADGVRLVIDGRVPALHWELVAE